MTRSGAKGEGSTGTAMYEDFISNQTINENFYNEEYKNEEGKVLKPAGEDTKVFDYGKMFVLPKASDLRRKYNLSAPFGSKEDNASSKFSNEELGIAEASENTQESWDESDIPF
jgi:hypothetical protein